MSYRDLTMNRWLGAALLVAGGAIGGGCSVGAGADSGGADSLRGSGSSSAEEDGGGLGLDASGAPVVVSSGTDAEPLAPPEVEHNPEFELPHAGERYVYAVNPESDTIAAINAADLSIHTVPAGRGPRFLQTLAGSDSAIVLNVESNDATVIHTEGGVSEHWNVPVRVGANAIAVASDGRHAVVYFDDRFSGSTLSAGNFQDVTVLAIDQYGAESTQMTVGYRPSAVTFDAVGSQAYVVTEDGVSIIDFEEVEQLGPGQARTVSVGDDVDDPGTDVSVSSDGKFAVARQVGGRVLRLVDLRNRDVTTLDVVSIVEAAVAPLGAAVGGLGSAGTSGAAGADGGANGRFGSGVAGASGAAGEFGVAATSGAAGESGAAAADGVGGTGSVEPEGSAPVAVEDLISDVDLSPDGRWVVAVVRYAGAVARIPVPEGFADPSLVELTVIPEGRIGQVTLTADGGRAVLYTTADVRDERITVLDFCDESVPRAVDLHKAVSQLAVTENGRTAFVVHQQTTGDPADSAAEQLVDQSHGYSLVNLDSGFPKLEITQSAVERFALVPDAGSVYLTFGVPAEVHRVGLVDFVHHTVPLASVPVAIGPVALSRRVFVSQEHPDGRITFINWDTAEVSTVTGFELNSTIRELQ